MRAFEWLRDVASHPIGDPINGQDDYWQTYVVNQVYNSVPAFVAFDELSDGTPGKAVAYTDWTTKNVNWP